MSLLTVIQFLAASAQTASMAQAPIEAFMSCKFEVGQDNHELRMEGVAFYFPNGVISGNQPGVVALDPHNILRGSAIDFVSAKSDGEITLYPFSRSPNVMIITMPAGDGSRSAGVAYADNIERAGSCFLLVGPDSKVALEDFKKNPALLDIRK